MKTTDRSAVEAVIVATIATVALALWRWDSGLIPWWGYLVAWCLIGAGWYTASVKWAAERKLANLGE